MPDQSGDRPAIPLGAPPKVTGDMGLGSREQMFKLRRKSATDEQAGARTPSEGVS
jgi:hypothetical protein